MRTFSIVKPDAVAAGNTGAILSALEGAGFRIVGLRMVRMTKGEAEGFYAVHRARPFFSSLTDFMSSGPAVVMALEREDAISELRRLMGATNPADAAPGTIRARFASSIERNAIHGSDAPDTAAFELGYFFPGVQLI
jgi:nucleoside-diphosphate kinase